VRSDQCIELRHICSDYCFVAVYLPGFPATEEYTFTCTVTYFINLGNQNSKSEPLLLTNQKPSCSSFTYQAPQITKKQKSHFSNWFAKKQLINQKKMTLELTFQLTLSRMQRISSRIALTFWVLLLAKPNFFPFNVLKC
jgi:hypothetical protein